MFLVWLAILTNWAQYGVERPFDYLQIYSNQGIYTRLILLYSLQALVIISVTSLKMPVIAVLKTVWIFQMTGKGF